MICFITLGVGFRSILLYLCKKTPNHLKYLLQAFLSVHIPLLVFEYTFIFIRIFHSEQMRPLLIWDAFVIIRSMTHQRCTRRPSVLASKSCWKTLLWHLLKLLLFPLINRFALTTLSYNNNWGLWYSTPFGTFFFQLVENTFN